MGELVMPSLPLERTGARRFARVRAYAVPIVVWSVWAAMTAAAFLFIRHYARNIPYHDDFAFVAPMTGHQPLTLSWLWQQHNEHRPAVSRLIMAVMYRLLPGDFRLAMYLNAALLSSAAAGMLYLARRLRGSTSLLDIVLPLAVLTIGQAETLLIGFAMNLMLTSWIACALIGLAATSGGQPSRWLILKLGLLLVLLPLCGGSGIVMLPPLLLWLVHRIWLCGRGQRADRIGGTIGAGLLILCLIVVGLYLYGYASPAHHLRAPSRAIAALTALQYLSLTVCPSTHDYWQLAGVVTLCLLSATLLVAGWITLRSDRDRPRAFALAMVVMGMVLPAVAIGYSRSFMWPGGGLANRYITTTAPLVCGLYVAWLALGTPRSRLAVHLVLVGLVLLDTPASFRAGIEFGRGRLEIFRPIEASFKAHAPISKVAQLSCPSLHPSADFARFSYVMLKDARVGGFGDLADDRLAVTPDRPGEPAGSVRK
jgi:hypothetical protein